MPFINDQYADFDPEKLADAVIAGHKIRPTVFDWEDAQTRQKRINSEFDQIDEILWRKNRDAWKKWRDGGQDIIKHPMEEWKKLPGLNPWTLASQETRQDTLKRPLLSNWKG